MRMSMMLAAAVLAGTTPAAAQQRGGLGRLMAADANGDGAITRAEAQTARRVQFERLDVDGDGILSQAERATASGGVRVLNQIPDGDGDGRIGRDEMMAAPYRAFDRLDSDRDGTISAAEIEAGRARAG